MTTQPAEAGGFPGNGPRILYWHLNAPSEPEEALGDAHVSPVVVPPWVRRGPRPAAGGPARRSCRTMASPGGPSPFGDGSSPAC